MDKSPSRRRHKRKRNSPSPRREKKSREPKEERKQKPKDPLPNLMFSSLHAGPHLTKVILKDFPKAQDVDSIRGKETKEDGPYEISIKEEVRIKVLADLKNE